MTSPALPGAAEVLLVEDDAGDVLLTSEAFAQHDLDVQLHVADGGEEEATRFLRRTGGFAGAPRPALVLLDLNLPLSVTNTPSVVVDQLGADRNATCDDHGSCVYGCRGAPCAAAPPGSCGVALSAKHDYPGSCAAGPVCWRGPASAGSS